MKRFDGNANNGFVNWPNANPAIHNSCEGGMSVYALWPESREERAAPGWNEEGFYNCFSGFRIKASVSESPVSDVSEVRDRPMYAAICLGTSGGSWVKEDGEFWEASAVDLTDGGLELVAALNVLYGTDAKLVTVVDT